jgi:hypothetical protein
MQCGTDEKQLCVITNFLLFSGQIVPFNYGATVKCQFMATQNIL